MNNQIKQLPLSKLERILPTEKIDIVLKNFTNKAENYMTEIGTFKPIVEKFTNDMPVVAIGNVVLSLSSTSDLNGAKERILQAAISTKSGQFVLEQNLIKGSREDILKYLKDDKFNETFKRFLMDCSDKFEQRGLE